MRPIRILSLSALAAVPLLLAIALPASAAVTSTQTGALSGMHIHRGVAGVNGPIVVNFDQTKLNGAQACTPAEPALAREIASTPSGFYVNVHTAQFPGGAVRGQLGTTRLVVALSGAQENPMVSGSASGTSIVTFPGNNQICADVTATGLGAATGMHIHRGATGVNGPVVVPFDETKVDAGNQCVTATPALVQELVSSTSGFYFNVHTAAVPGGAIRGQLAGFQAQQVPVTTTTTVAPVVAGAVAVNRRRSPVS